MATHGNLSCVKCCKDFRGKEASSVFEKWGKVYRTYRVEDIDR